MEKISKVNSEDVGPAPKRSKGSSWSQEDDALSQLSAKDPVLGRVMKMIMGKLDETNKKLDSFHTELRRDLHKCQGQVDKLLDANQMEDNTESTEMIESVKVENSVDTGGPRSEDCLDQPIVLRRILEQFSTKELMDLSLVNKLWNFEVRTVLRDGGCLTARIYPSPACQSLVRFASVLQKMRVVPFTGINVSIDHATIDHSKACKSLASESLNPSYQVILDRLPWKHLSVEFRRNSPLLQDRPCPAFLLVRRTLEDHCGVLEELSFERREELDEFFESIFKCRSFPCLKIVKFAQYGSRTRAHSADLVKSLVSSAPNSTKLCMEGPIEFKENVMEGSSAELFSTSGLRPLKKQVCESLIPALRTETMYVFRGRKQAWNFDLELLNRFVPMVMQASHSTLTSLQMDLLFAVPLMCYGICLETLTSLWIVITEQTVGRQQPHTLTLVKGLDFTRVFPKLKKVEIFYRFEHRDFSLDDIGAFVERGNAVAEKALLDRAVNIRHLELHYDYQNFTPPLIFLAQLFPHVKTLSVKIGTLQESTFALLWEHFGCLEELYVDFDRFNAPTRINLDSVFCGIFPEEVAELRAKDEEYLKAVNIVPVMPSIACMRGLRSLTLRHEYYDPDSESSTRMFSKVTGLIGFPRCLHLSVKFETSRSVRKALDHLKPYVTVVTERREEL